MMQSFEYAAPETREEAVRLLTEASGGAVILAGGTDLLSLMKSGVRRPARLVSLRAVAGLRGVRRTAEGLVIGAMTTLDELLADARLGADYPSLKHAAEGITSPQIRSMGTVGGELLQSPRCWYFRGGHGLLARRADAPMVPDGDNRYHAILGNAGPALYVHPSSLAPALIALGATARIFGAKGAREAKVATLFRTPATSGESETTLVTGEILTEIAVPLATGTRNATYEVRQRTALDWPLAAASVAFRLDGGLIRSPRVVLGHVAPVPWASQAAEKVLEGAAPGPAAAAKAGDAAVTDARPLSHNAYKVRLARTAVKRAILRALGEEVP